MTTRSAQKLHSQLNPYFKSKLNPNWKAIVDAIGEIDEDTANLIQEVRKQFFINTAERPYIDRLAANLNIQRPRIVGMSDSDFRKYVPIMAYQPKQVKLIMDKLIDLFFFKEATTAFAQSLSSEPFYLEDEWELIYKVDNENTEQIIFRSEDFTLISSASAEEIASAINRQAQKSFAIVFDDRIQKRKYIRIFTQTVGSKGSIEVLGGRANISLEFLGSLQNSGSGTTTQWLITKVGSTTTFQYVGGDSPNLNYVQVGDNVIIDIPDNSGTFAVTEVDISNNSFSFENVFSLAGSFDHSLLANSYVRFIRPQKSIVWNKQNRAAVWEVSPGEIIVEIPATPPVVRRDLKGSAHLNGKVNEMTDIPNSTSIIIDDASEWPTSGMFVLEPVQSIEKHILTNTVDEVISQNIDGRFNIQELRFTYSGKSGNTLLNVYPELPRVSEVSEISVTSASRVSGVASIVTIAPHKLVVGQAIRILDMADTTFNGVFTVSEIVNSSTFKYVNPGPDTTSNSGYVRAEFVGLSPQGSKVYLTTAKVNSGLFGPYMWDSAADFVLSSYTANLASEVKAGNIVLNLQINTPNNIPVEQGFLIFDYGLETQEGPVRYLYKASDSILALDPSYVFKFDHPQGASITAIRRKGGHVLSGLGTEYPFYVSDPAAARLVLQDLIADVKSVGVFLRFIVRYPKLAYATLDTYQSGVDPG
jgi:hypothetical protein